MATLIHVTQDPLGFSNQAVEKREKELKRRVGELARNIHHYLEELAPEVERPDYVRESGVYIKINRSELAKLLCRHLREL